MTDFEKFIKENAVEFSNNRVDADFIPVLEKGLDIHLGDQLKAYILNYGYMAYKFVELNGINKAQGMNSDMAKMTLSLRKNFPCTNGFVALEDAGDGDYFLVDSQDTIFEFIPELGNTVKPLNQTFFEYIYTRFKAIS